MILLLRDEKPNDLYKLLFKRYSIPHKFAPLLAFEYCNQDTLYQYFSQLKDQFSGVIFTSQRAVTALSSLLDVPESGLKSTIKSWKHEGKFVYCIGIQTSEQLKEIGFENIDYYENSARSLAEYIILRGQTLNQNSKKLLYLCGNLRRDELPNLLKQHSIAFQELEVYITITTKDQIKSNLGMESTLIIHINGTNSHAANILYSELPEWIVFFSPSGVGTFLQSIDSTLLDMVRYKTKKVAIGKTTAQAMTEQGLTVEATAVSPSPEGLLEAIINYNK